MRAGVGFRRALESRPGSGRASDVGEEAGTLRDSALQLGRPPRLVNSNARVYEVTDATRADAASQHRWASRVLRLMLILRLLWNAAFSVLLLTRGPQSLGGLLVLFGRFAVVDGALALLAAGGYLTVTPSRMLWLSPTVDAVTRAVLVGLLFVGPGISTFPLTSLLYVGLIATFACFDGVLDAIEGLALRNEFGSRGGAVSLIVSGTILALLGGKLFATQPDVREMALVLALLSVTHAIASVPAIIHVTELRRQFGEPSRQRGPGPDAKKGGTHAAAHQEMSK